MKNNIIYISLLSIIFSGLFFSSCEDSGFLNKQPSNELTKEEVFSLWTNTQRFHYDTYNFFRHGAGRVSSSWLDSSTDIGATSYSWGGVRTSFNIGNYYSSGGAAELVDSWEHHYRAIRKCNMLLENIDDVPKAESDSEDVHQMHVRHYKAESRFLRAYFYWELYLRYGPIPIIKEVLDPYDDLLSEYSVRPTHKEYVIDFVVKELTECEETLMDKPLGDNGELTVDNNLAGRICKPAARALKSRIMLYMASDRYSKLFEAEGSTPVSWDEAADAAKSFIDDFEDLYGLYYGTSNDPLQQYQGAILVPQYQGNNEVIMWRNDGQIGWSAIRNDTPVGEGGNGGLCPTQNLVDMYDMDNGLSPFTKYDETGAPVYSSSKEVKDIINPESGYDDQKPYENRDPRFYRTILYHESVWNNRTINVIRGASDNPRGNANATPTGYYVRKYIPEGILAQNHALTAYRNWIFIRYAEILLNYAEATNEAYGPTDEVFNALQAIRDRVGLTQRLSTRSDLLSQSSLRNFIRKERTIELAFEEHRVWDVRRWNVAEEALGRPIIGVEVAKKDDGTLTFTRKIAQQRVFSKEMYLYPIPETEEWKTNIENNPGW